jgi:hypothetical protein
MTTTTNTAPVPALILDLMDDLTGFHPALDRAVAALGELLAADLTADQSQSLVAALGGLADGGFTTLTALVVQRIANPDTNPALAELDADRKQTLRRLGSEYTALVNDSTDTASELSAAIDGA